MTRAPVRKRRFLNGVRGPGRERNGGHTRSSCRHPKSNFSASPWPLFKHIFRAPLLGKVPLLCASGPTMFDDDSVRLWTSDSD